MGDYLLFMLSAIIINNILLIKFLGVCPFIGVSGSMDSAIGMAAACVFVNVLATSLCWMVQMFVLEPLGLEYIQTLAFIVVIAALVQLVEIVLQKVAPPLYRALGIYLPLITTNCMIFGVAVLNIREERGFIDAVVYAFSTAAGFSIALILLASIRERFAIGRIPKVLQGFPSGLITAGIVALSFYGLVGLA
ncbi:MAG: RnfABCDGE type electron transport complex subunit A [Deltaproteobacteria bacterium]|jgi:electron transport complex protein RnfA|nr:RnfABCDGE type electron transport complex subunit A [Deltaproteobacteria bacterium]MDL1976790.1 RnfABCDGE type electron transport complex subunit A [Deltaproteobacteria bacterium]OEU53693.1 MAG: electron transport complex subunit RsxA [Desulfobacterales bacterium C00003106]OEU59085.1 MAG: electron transport complex subunit RsxA [Desulfobacterales bacterium C00003104]